MPKGKAHRANEWTVFLAWLVDTRGAAKLTLAALANLAGLSQPYVSQVESGNIRLDTVQLRDWLHACGSNLGRFGRALEKQLAVQPTAQ